MVLNCHGFLIQSAEGAFLWCLGVLDTCATPTQLSADPLAMAMTTASGGQQGRDFHDSSGTHGACRPPIDPTHPSITLWHRADSLGHRCRLVVPLDHDRLASRDTPEPPRLSRFSCYPATYLIDQLSIVSTLEGKGVLLADVVHFRGATVVLAGA